MPMQVNKQGFTFIELIVVISLVLIVSTIGTSAYFGLRVRNEVSAAEQTIVAGLYEAQQQALGQVQSSDWGVKIATSTVTLFSGSSFATRDNQYDIELDIPTSGTITGDDEVVFLRKTGRISADKQINIEYEGYNSTITINTLGVLSH